MKRVIGPLYAFFFCALALTGCGSSSYSIFERQEGTGIKSVHVTVVPEVTTNDMQTWAQEIEASEKVQGKEFMIVFYKGRTRVASDVMATYEGGTLYSVSEADRQESAREGE